MIVLLVSLSTISLIFYLIFQNNNNDQGGQI
nr:MAG TPA: protein of unknown function (DUF4577) [Caudoviricetes sp.]